MADLKTNKAADLRGEYPVFLYEHYSYEQDGDNLVILFNFKVKEVSFNPKVTIENVSKDQIDSLDKEALDNFIFHLGLVEMLSYWKATISKTIEVKAGNLNPMQINWWEDLLKNGLGEFFYKNDIDFTKGDFVEIVSASDYRPGTDKATHANRALVMNSGGRDSIVSLELLKETGKEAAVFMLNPTEAALKTQEESKLNQKIIVRREIDKTLLDLNSKGYLNGHTPFSAYLAFLSLLCAYIFNYNKVISSNERSSNEENVEYMGQKINHQYSKSFDFEKTFREYAKYYLSDDLEYLSLLRPLYEIQISKIFAQYPQYFPIFKSCNVGQKTNSWCGSCPKCLSIFISLYPFLKYEEIIKIFKVDLYENENLKDLLLHICGKVAPKPFECVGTYAEVLEGLKLSIGKFEKGQELPPLLLYAKNNIVFGDFKFDLKSWGDNTFEDNELTSILKEKIQK